MLLPSVNSLRETGCRFAGFHPRGKHPPAPFLVIKISSRIGWRMGLMAYLPGFISSQAIPMRRDLISSYCGSGTTFPPYI
jgi:hypothetical protein